mgnify:CR=1 FL=1
MDVKKLEDHYRIATRISEKEGKYVSALLYVNANDGEECIDYLEKVREIQKNIYNERK